MEKHFRLLYIKTFLLYSVLFGAIMSVWEYYDTGHVNIIKQVFQSMFFGSILSWTNVTAKRRAMSEEEKEQHGDKEKL